jgi:hypothetical protein
VTIVGRVWHPIGPSPINERDNGRTNAVAVHPQNSQVAYIGAACGGVWKTTDGGASWRPLFDRQPSLEAAQISLAIGEPAGVAIDPNDADIIYAASGPRRLAPNDAVAVGVFKSTDGGASWVLLGSGYPADNTGNAATTFVTKTINTIVVDPADSSVVYAAAENGVWRSANGGLDWTLGTGSGGRPETGSSTPGSTSKACTSPRTAARTGPRSSARPHPRSPRRCPRCPG